MRSDCFFFNDTATTEIYTLSLHDALPICADDPRQPERRPDRELPHGDDGVVRPRLRRSEEHTSELQSRSDLVCRLLLEKKNAASYAKTSVACTVITHCHHECP